MPRLHLKNKLKMIVLIGCICISSTGCAQMVVLSPDEEDAIAAYSANVISKFNKKQNRGIIAAPYPVEKPEVEEEPQEEETEDKGNSTGNKELDAATSKPLGEVIGVDGVSFDYSGARAEDTVQVADYLELTPDRGNSYVVASFTVKNNLTTPVELNLAAMNLKFSAGLNGTNVASDASILPNDLTSFNNTLDAGATQEMVVLFQFKSESIADISGLKLGVRREGIIYQIAM